MKVIRLLICLYIVVCCISCKSTIKEQTDKVYSRHLQRYVDLTIITTAKPDKKEDMNLLLFTDSKYLETTRAKGIIDSLYKKKKIQPMLLVAMRGQQGDYGLEESDKTKAKQFKKYNEFVINELYAFVKKKTVIRKFNSVAICGFGASAISSFDIAWNNDEKIGMAGMFDPTFVKASNDSSILQTLQGLRKRPNLKIWLAASSSDTSALLFKNMMDNRKSITECSLTTSNEARQDANFAAFILWAFPK
ncbi:MAG: alpha/beta hydrolase-fold protein [Ferruginibacter sp.]